MAAKVIFLLILSVNNFNQSAKINVESIRKYHEYAGKTWLLEVAKQGSLYLASMPLLLCLLDMAKIALLHARLMQLNKNENYHCAV